ncbi:MAG: hypothetical protein ACLFM7_13790 [Bacteroidales bacterium]
MKQYITQHLEKNNLKIPVHTGIDTVCAFSGERITEGVKLKDLIKKTFTDYEMLRYPSDYAGIDIAMMMEEVIPGEKKMNSLRNYSFYADENELKLLKRSEILDLLFNIPGAPFQIGITYNNKKHIAYRAPVNGSGEDQYDIITDEGIVRFNRKDAWEIWSVAREMYTIIPEKANTKQQPTFFTKANISGDRNPDYKQIKRYGFKKYILQNKFLDQYRDTALFKLIINLLNKAS